MAIYLERDLSGESAQSLEAYLGGISNTGITSKALSAALPHLIRP